MSKLRINIARRPFVNRRPLWVATMVVAVIAGAVTFVNVYGLMSALARDRVIFDLTQMNQEAADTAIEATKVLGQNQDENRTREIRKVATSVAGIIQKRRLSWSQLLDELATALPDDVRVLSVVPNADGNRIELLLRGEAKDNSAKLQFLSRLQEAPFSSARLMGETMEKGQIGFHASCNYDPPQADPAALTAPTTEDGATAGAPRRAALDTSVGDMPAAGGTGR